MAHGKSTVAPRAAGLLVRFQKGVTLLALIVALAVIEPLEVLNVGLQARDNTVSGMVKAVDAVKSSLLGVRTEDGFANIYNSAQTKVAELDLEDIAAPRVRRPPKRFATSEVEVAAETPIEHFRSEFFKVVDTAVQQLSSRIEQDGVSNYIKLEQVLLRGNISDACNSYPELDVPLLRIQLPMFCHQFKYSSTDEAAMLMRSVAPEVRKLFTQVEVLLRLLLVVPASSCEAERSFSALRRLKTWLRSTMTQQRLNHVALCSVHHHYIDNIDIRAVANDFVSGIGRREQLFGTF